MAGEPKIVTAEGTMECRLSVGVRPSDKATRSTLVVREAATLEFKYVPDIGFPMTYVNFPEGGFGAIRFYNRESAYRFFPICAWQSEGIANILHKVHKEIILKNIFIELASSMFAD